MLQYLVAIRSTERMAAFPVRPVKSPWSTWRSTSMMARRAFFDTSRVMIAFLGLSPGRGGTDVCSEVRVGAPR